MSVLLNVAPGSRIIELGGGDNPNPNSTVNVDVRQGPKVHFTVDFENQIPWPIADNDFDGAYSAYCLEHISFAKAKAFLSEMLRIIKPGAKAVVLVPNFEAQVEWMKKNPTGWDGKDFFTAASELIFGSQDYRENAHRAVWCPAVAEQLFREAGFDRITTMPYGSRDTDLCISAVKPVGPGPSLEAEVCGAVGPGNVTCVLAKGHQGKHRGSQP